MLHSKVYRFLEFFAGQGQLTAALKDSGFTGIQFDRDYGGRHQNIFEAAGMACLCCKHYDKSIDREDCIAISYPYPGYDKA